MVLVTLVDYMVVVAQQHYMVSSSLVVQDKMAQSVLYGALVGHSQAHKQIMFNK
jgi:hypothetical protein